MTLLVGKPFDEVAKFKRVLVAGAGGGFDIYAGVPIALALHSAGINVTLANLSFTYLGGTDARVVAPHTFRVQSDSQGEDRYFPERILTEWLDAKRLPLPVYAFEKVGVQQIRAAYRYLIAAHNVDAVVLVDGGTDILMRGDEESLGTPHEDMVSLAAVNGIPDVAKFVACIGFGIDSFHGVCRFVGLLERKNQRGNRILFAGAAAESSGADRRLVSTSGMAGACPQWIDARIGGDGDRPGSAELRVGFRLDHSRPWLQSQTTFLSASQVAAQPWGSNANGYGLMRRSKRTER